MAKDFNVYQWRRNHLNENQVSENTPSWKEEFKDIMKANNLTPGEVMDFVSIYFKDEKGKPNMIGLNEEDKIKNEVTKKIKDLTIQDVIGTYLPPTKNSTTSEYIDDRPMFDDNWRQTRLDRWRNTLYQDSPGSEEWEVTIGKNSINRKVLDFGNNPEAQKYKEAEEKRTQAAQADYTANRGRYQGD